MKLKGHVNLLVGFTEIDGLPFKIKRILTCESGVQVRTGVNKYSMSLNVHIYLSLLLL